MKSIILLLTCEHAGNQIPDIYLPYFEQAELELDSHRGWDPGALFIANHLSKELSAELYQYPYSRLLIEPNRSLSHADVFSECSLTMPEETQQLLITEFYHPYRDSVYSRMTQLLEDYHQVVHLSVHTFTSIWKGVPREVEIGLLFDNHRSTELDFCKIWKEKLEVMTDKSIRYNEPYAGADDGFTTFLRNQFGEEQYLGLELEVSQKFDEIQLAELGANLVESLKQTMKAYENRR